MSVLSVQHQRQELLGEPYSFLLLCKFQLLQHLRITRKTMIKSQKKPRLKYVTNYLLYVSAIYRTLPNTALLHGITKLPALLVFLQLYISFRNDFPN